MQNNAPCHKAKTSVSWFERNKIKCLDWPPTSPDLNPIKNIWSDIDRKLCKVQTSSIANLQAEIEKLWKDLDQNYCKNFELAR